MCTPYTPTPGSATVNKPGPGPEVTDPGRKPPGTGQEVIALGEGGAGPSTPSATTRGQDPSAREASGDEGNSSK